MGYLITDRCSSCGDAVSNPFFYRYTSLDGISSRSVLCRECGIKHYRNSTTNSAAVEVLKQIALSFKAAAEESERDGRKLLVEAGHIQNVRAMVEREIDALTKKKGE